MNAYSEEQDQYHRSGCSGCNSSCSTVGIMYERTPFPQSKCVTL